MLNTIYLTRLKKKRGLLNLRWNKNRKSTRPALPMSTARLTTFSSVIQYSKVPDRMLYSYMTCTVCIYSAITAGHVIILPMWVQKQSFYIIFCIVSDSRSSRLNSCVLETGLASRQTEILFFFTRLFLKKKKHGTDSSKGVLRRRFFRNFKRYGRLILSKHLNGYFIEN